MTIISTTGAGCLAKHAPQRDPHALSRVSLSNFFSTPPHPVRIPRLRTHREIDWWRGHIGAGLQDRPSAPGGVR